MQVASPLECTFHRSSLSRQRFSESAGEFSDPAEVMTASASAKETLESPDDPGDNGPVIAGQEFDARR